LIDLLGLTSTLAVFKLYRGCVWLLLLNIESGQYQNPRTVRLHLLQ
jgi:hypothetical protein